TDRIIEYCFVPTYAQIRNSLGKPLAHRLFISPERRGGKPCRRRYHFRNHLKGLSDKSFRSPIRHGDESSRPAHADQFGSYAFRTGREHSPEHRQHNIEFMIADRKLLSVPFLEAYFNLFCCRTLSRLFKHIVRDVYACDQTACPRRRDRSIPRA